MEKIVQFVASLPDTSKSSAKITDGFISNLWNVLHHPPLSYLGDKYQYRNAEGADNVSHLERSFVDVEHHVPASREVGYRICQKRETSSHSTCCSSRCRDS